MKKCKRVAMHLSVILISFFVMTALTFGSQLNPVVPESVGMSSERLASIDKMAEKAVEEKYLKGVVVLVARHGKICYFKAFGEADEGKPMKTDAIFRLASMTKTPVGVALMQLWEQGRFQLKDPVSKYIPEFKEMKVAVRDANDQIALVSAKREITIHDVLSFTSGMSATYMAGLGPTYKYVAEEYAKAGVQDLMSETYTKSIAENVKAAATCSLFAQPGEAWCYSNISMDLVAYLVEIFSGKPLDAYLQENIFKPLKMREIWFYPPEGELSRIPAVFNNPGELVKVTKEWKAGTGVIGPLYTFAKNKTYFSAGAGLHGTTYAYYRFAQMLLNKGELDGIRILSPQAVEVMTTVQVGEGKEFRNLFSNNKWGYAVDIQEDTSMRPLKDWYGGPGSFGWRGYWSTMYFIDPLDDTVVMTMAQTPRHGYSWGCKVSVAAGAAINE